MKAKRRALKDLYVSLRGDELSAVIRLLCVLDRHLESAIETCTPPKGAKVDPIDDCNMAIDRSDRRAADRLYTKFKKALEAARNA